MARGGVSGLERWRGGALMVPLIMAIVSINTAAAEPSFMQSVRARYGAAATVDAAFDLLIDWKARETQEKKTGRLYLAPGDKFRVELDNSVWVSDGRTYWQYSKGSGQVIIRRLADADLSVHPSQILSAYVQKRAYVLKSEDDKMAVVESAGDSAGAHIASVSLWVDKKSSTVKRIAVLDKNGNVSTYSFKRVRLGIPLPQETFRFDAPKNAQVLDMRE